MYIVLNLRLRVKRGDENEYRICGFGDQAHTVDTLEDAADLQAEEFEIYGYTIDSYPICRLEQVDPLIGRIALAKARERKKEND